MERDKIIKALECCSKDDCDNCPNDFGNCYANLAGYALALIKELTEENERLSAEVSVKKKLLDKCVDLEDRVKADTVRKMQERLKERLEKPEFPWDSFTVAEEVIDQIAKEMLEDTNES